MRRLTERSQVGISTMRDWPPEVKEAFVKLIDTFAFVHRDMKDLEAALELSDLPVRTPTIEPVRNMVLQAQGYLDGAAREIQAAVEEKIRGRMRP